MASPEIIGTLAGAKVLLDREAQALIIAAERPIRFHIDHPYIQGTKLEKDARAALAQTPVSYDRRPCMYEDGIVAADDSCLRCRAPQGTDCRDI